MRGNLQIRVLLSCLQFICRTSFVLKNLINWLEKAPRLSVAINRCAKFIGIIINITLTLMLTHTFVKFGIAISDLVSYVCYRLNKTIIIADERSVIV